MEIKKFEESDYPLLCSWWFEHGWNPIPLELLPKMGYIVDDICAGFIYLNDSKFCHLEWIISDPRSSKKERDETLNVLIDHLCSVAKDLGYTTVFSATKHESLVNRYKNKGFIVTDNNMTHLIKRI